MCVSLYKCLLSSISTDQFQTKYYLPVSSGSILIPRPTEPDRITDDIMTTSEPDTGDREEEEEEVSPTLPPTFPTRPTETPPPERGKELFYIYPTLYCSHACERDWRCGYVHVYRTFVH